jgi:cytochrome c556
MSRKRLFMCGTLAAALLVALTAAAMTASEAIKERQQAMEDIGAGMATFGAIAKKEQPFDPEVVNGTAAMIAENLTQSGDLFPEGSDTGEVQTWAKPEIWTDRAAFDEIMDSTLQAAVDLQSVTEAEAFLPALGKLGNGCKSCHDLYRSPKK